MREIEGEEKKEDKCSMYAIEFKERLGSVQITRLGFGCATRQSGRAGCGVAVD